MRWNVLKRCYWTFETCLHSSKLFADAVAGCRDFGASALWRATWPSQGLRPSNFMGAFNGVCCLEPMRLASLYVESENNET